MWLIKWINVKQKWKENLIKVCKVCKIKLDAEYLIDVMVGNHIQQSCSMAENKFFWFFTTKINQREGKYLGQNLLLFNF